MKTQLRALSLALVAISSPTTLLAAPISFVEAWDILQQNNNSLKAQRSNVERQQHMQTATNSLNLPSVTLAANFTRLDSDVVVTGEQFADSLSGIPAGLAPLIGGLQSAGLDDVKSTLSERDIFTSSIRAVWPIFTGGKISAVQSAAEGKTDEAKSKLAMETQARFEDLSKYYFSVLLAQEVVSTRKAVEIGLEQHQSYAVKLEQQGQIAKVERLQAEASLAKAVVDRKKAQHNLKIAQSALTQTLSQEIIVEPSGALFINRYLPNMATFIDQTLNTYPGLDLLDAKEKQARSLIKAEQGKYYPDVYLYGDYSLHEEDSLVGTSTPEWLVGIGVNINLIDTSGRSDKVSAASSAVNQVHYLKAQAKQDLRVLVEKTYLEAQQAIDEVIGLDSSLSLAQENLSLRKKAFNQGLATSLDVVDAELYLASIKTQQSVARFNYLVSLNKLLALTSEMGSFSSYERKSIQNANTRAQDNNNQTSQSNTNTKEAS